MRCEPLVEQPSSLFMKGTPARTVSTHPPFCPRRHPTFRHTCERSRLPANHSLAPLSLPPRWPERSEPPTATPTTAKAVRSVQRPPTGDRLRERPSRTFRGRTRAWSPTVSPRHPLRNAPKRRLPSLLLPRLLLRLRHRLLQLRRSRALALPLKSSSLKTTTTLMRSSSLPTMMTSVQIGAA